MIYTVTCNPALDYYIRLPRLEMGQINRVTRERLCCGGKGVNVSRALARWGVPTQAWGLLAGMSGRLLERELADEGVTGDFVFLTEGMTRLNIKWLGGEQTELNGLGPRVGEEGRRALLTRVERLQPGDILVLAGSVPPGLGEECYAQAAAAARQRGARCVVDAAGGLLRQALRERPNLIKPNRQEIRELTGADCQRPEQALAAAVRLQQLGARHVLLSLGEMGAVLAWADGRHWVQPAPAGHISCAVGAGDAMLAGFLAGLLDTGEPARALALAVAAGSAAAFQGDIPSRQQVERLLPQLPAGRRVGAGDEGKGERKDE